MSDRGYADFREGFFQALVRIALGIVQHMTSGGFLSMASVVAILAAVAALAVVSALALAPLDRPSRRRRSVAFAFCLLGTWTVALFVIALIRNTI